MECTKIYVSEDQGRPIYGESCKLIVSKSYNPVDVPPDGSKGAYSKPSSICSPHKNTIETDTLASIATNTKTVLMSHRFIF